MIDDAVETGIIEPEALSALLANDEAPSIKILDATFSLPGSNENPYHDYLKRRIHDAQFFDIKNIASSASSLPNMLPSAEEFETHMGNMGISNDDFVIVYGQSGMVMGPARAWWMFRAFGHERVCVLNGGLPAWLKEGHALTEGLPPSVSAGSYSAELDDALVRDLGDMLDITADDNEHDCLILDARSEGRFSGKMAEPRPGMRSGHIPGSLNLPCINLIDHETGKLKSADELSAIFDDIGFEEDTPLITTCGSGVTACVISLALFNLGHENIPVYDGSWSEWGRENAPTEVEISENDESE